MTCLTLGGGPSLEFTTVIASVSYTASAFDFIEARTESIYLPASPVDRDVIIVASNYSGNVIIYGNGTGIYVTNQEESSVTLSQRGTTLQLRYFTEGGYWRIV